jgi:hypothetical protein
MSDTPIADSNKAFAVAQVEMGEAKRAVQSASKAASLAATAALSEREKAAAEVAYAESVAANDIERAVAIAKAKADAIVEAARGVATAKATAAVNKVKMRFGAVADKADAAAASARQRFEQAKLDAAQAEATFTTVAEENARLLGR